MPLRTPLYELHRSAGSTFIEFGGWEMPLQFSGIVAEHLAVRAGAGLFDVSHMGKLLISGAGARDFLNRISANEISKSPNRARYTHLLDDTGRIIDDVIVTCLGPERFFMVCNAGPREKVIAWMRKHSHDVKIEDRTFEYLCLALQGPKAARVLQLLTQYDITSIKGFSGAYCDLLLGERPGTGRVARSAPPETGGRGPFFGGPEVGNGDFCYVTRTGYTGEDGFELFPPKAIAEAVWNGIVGAGRGAGIQPIGLGARDTLRLEKGYLLSGTDFDGRQTPLECASEWLVKWDHEFIGREALQEQKKRGDYDRLVGVSLEEKGVPRHECEVLHEGRRAGAVTSGTMSPSLKKGIALARVRPPASAEGTKLAVVVRDRPLRAIVKKPPFL